MTESNNQEPLETIQAELSPVKDLDREEEKKNGLEKITDDLIESQNSQVGELPRVSVAPSQVNFDEELNRTAILPEASTESVLFPKVLGVADELVLRSNVVSLTAQETENAASLFIREVYSKKFRDVLHKKMREVGVTAHHKSYGRIGAKFGNTRHTCVSAVIGFITQVDGAVPTFLKMGLAIHKLT